MIQLPEARRLPTARRYAARRQLEQYVSRRGWARRRFVVGVVLAIVAGGSVGAIGLLRSTPVTNRQTARCYVSADVGHDETFNGTTIEPPGPPGTKEQVDNAIDRCTALWRGGFFVPGKYGMQRPAANEANPVPPLIACVLPDGRAAVFPGDARTCELLGLPLASQ